MTRIRLALGAAALLAGADKAGLWFGDVPLSPATVSDATLGVQPGPNDLMTFRLTGDGLQKMQALMKASLGKQVPLTLGGRVITMVRVNDVVTEPYASATVPDADAPLVMAAAKGGTPN
jgi:hypothetical protein